MLHSSFCFLVCECVVKWESWFSSLFSALMGYASRVTQRTGKSNKYEDNILMSVDRHPLHWKEMNRYVLKESTVTLSLYVRVSSLKCRRGKSRLVELKVSPPLPVSRVATILGYGGRRGSDEWVRQGVGRWAVRRACAAVVDGSCARLMATLVQVLPVQEFDI